MLKRVSAGVKDAVVNIRSDRCLPRKKQISMIPWSWRDGAEVDAVRRAVRSEKISRSIQRVDGL